MRPGTLFCLVMVKWFELAFLTLITAFMIAGTVQLNQRNVDGEANHLVVLSIISSVLAGLNLFYNNLFMNIRYKMKKDCYTCGHVIYDIPNLLCLTFLLKWLCQDRWHIRHASVLKWIFNLAWFITCIVLIKKYRHAHPELYEFDRFNDEVPIHLDDLMIVYLLQHIIFVCMRPFFLCCFMCCAPFLDLGKPYEKSDPLDFSIISYNYIAYMQRRTRNDDGHPVLKDEYDMLKQREVIRNHALEETKRSLRQNPNQVREGFTHGLIEFMGHNDHRRMCMICCLSINECDKVVRLACNVDHVFHESCYESMMKYYEEQGMEEEEQVCPICNQTIDPEKVISHEIFPKT